MSEEIQDAFLGGDPSLDTLVREYVALALRSPLTMGRCLTNSRA